MQKKFKIQENNKEKKKKEKISLFEQSKSNKQSDFEILLDILQGKF